jgi:hypothetical protein
LYLFIFVFAENANFPAKSANYFIVRLDFQASGLQKGAIRLKKYHLLGLSAALYKYLTN